MEISELKGKEDYDCNYENEDSKPESCTWTFYKLAKKMVTWILDGTKNQTGAITKVLNLKKLMKTEISLVGKLSFHKITNIIQAKKLH